MGWDHGYGSRTEHAGGWTDERVELLKKLWTEGQSGSQIARQMGGGLTRSGAIAKVHRLGLPKRDQDTKKVNQKRATPRGERVRGATAPRLPASKPTAKPPAVPSRTFCPEEPVPVMPEGPGLCTSLVELGTHMCRWPIGDPQDADFTFCGRKTDGVYCEGHAVRAYDRPQRTPAQRVADDARRAKAFERLHRLSA